MIVEFNNPLCEFFINMRTGKPKSDLLTFNIIMKMIRVKNKLYLSRILLLHYCFSIPFPNGNTLITVNNLT